MENREQDVEVRTQQIKKIIKILSTKPNKLLQIELVLNMNKPNSSVLQNCPRVNHLIDQNSSTLGRKTVK